MSPLGRRAHLDRLGRLYQGVQATIGQGAQMAGFEERREPQEACDARKHPDYCEEGHHQCHTCVLPTDGGNLCTRPRKVPGISVWP